MLQWNCRSIQSSLTDLICISNWISPDVIALQETWLSKESNFHMKNYRIYRPDRQQRGGGLLLLVSSKFCHKVNLVYQFMDAHCEIQAVNLLIPDFHPITIANVYFSSGVHNTPSLDALLSSGRSNVLLLGDFNPHHTMWGFRTDQCGSRLQN